MPRVRSSAFYAICRDLAFGRIARREASELLIEPERHACARNRGVVFRTPRPAKERPTLRIMDGHLVLPGTYDPSEERTMHALCLAIRGGRAIGDPLGRRGCLEQLLLHAA